MIIDCILDRKSAERANVPYHEGDFYRAVMAYIGGAAGDAAEQITRAMDYGDENDVRKALSAYILDYGYNPELVPWIYRRAWLHG